MVYDDNFHTALITGCAGSGKTTVSVYRLVRLNNQGEKVRLLTLQNMLVVFIRNLVVNNSEQTVDIQRDVPRDCISTFHDWFYKTRKMGFSVDNPPPLDAIHRAFQEKGFKPRMAVELLIDEGQDLPQWVYEVLPDYYSRFLVGADKAQQVHVEGTEPDTIRALFRNDTRYHRFLEIPLGQIFRLTYETYVFARQFIPQTNKEVWHPNILNGLRNKKKHGRKPMVIPYRDIASRNAHMRKILDNATGIVGILCPIGPARLEHHSGESVGAMHALLASWGISATKYYSKDQQTGEECPIPERLKRYIVTTFKSAKGLEFDTVVIPRLNFFRDPESDDGTTIREEMYVACTRAKTHLYVYRDLSNPQYDPIADFVLETYVGHDGASVSEQNATSVTQSV